MIGIDTNVIVRLIVADDPRQADAAERFIRNHCSAEAPGRISHTCLVELVWVLEDAYGYDRRAIASAIEGLLSTAQLGVPDAPLVNRALAHYRAGRADFADCMIGLENAASGCEYTATFDRRASRLAEFRLVG